jgi:hypothetical protein
MVQWMPSRNETTQYLYFEWRLSYVRPLPRALFMGDKNASRNLTDMHCLASPTGLARQVIRSEWVWQKLKWQRVNRSSSNYTQTSSNVEERVGNERTAYLSHCPHSIVSLPVVHENRKRWGCKFAHAKWIGVRRLAGCIGLPSKTD